MKALGLIIIALIALNSVEMLSFERVKGSETIARDCMFTVGINPIAINRIRKGDFSKDDEKSHVSD